MPLARSEVAGAALEGEIAVAAGFLANGASSPRVEAYSPTRRTWRRLPDLPVAVNHPMAASYRGRLYVVGGYSGGVPLRTASMLAGGRWRSLPPLPLGRAAGGAAVMNGRLYVVGGVGPGRILAKVAYVLDLRGRSRWRTLPGPTPREHLGVAALRGAVYAVAGRTRGFDTNLRLVESLRGDARRWRRRAPVPEPRGGTGATAAAGLLLSVGGEAPGGTLERVFSYNPRTNVWRRLPDLPTPRHGLALVGLGTRVFAIGGGARPGLATSGANESLDLTP